MQKQKLLKTTRRSLIIFFVSLVVTLALGMSARLFVSYRLYKAVSHSATKISALWSEFFSQFSFPRVNMPPEVALDAELYSKSDFSDIKLNMTYNPVDAKIAATLYGSCVDGATKELYAFVDKSSAGFSFGEQGDKFYTLPSKTFAQGVGMLGSLMNYQSYTVDAQKLKTIYEVFVSQKNNAYLYNSKTREKLFSLVCSTNLSAFDNDKYTVKVKISDLRDVADVMTPQLSQNFLASCDSDSFFTFIIHMSGNNLQLIECITPLVSNRIYYVGFDFENEFKDIGLYVSELVSERNLLNIKTSLNDNQVFMDLDFNSCEFDMCAIYDISQSEIYSRFSAGKYQNIVVRGGKDDNGYVVTVVCTDPTKDNVMNLKFLQDVSREKKFFSNISTNKVTFGEIMKLQKELSFFFDLYTKQ